MSAAKIIIYLAVVLATGVAGWASARLEEQPLETLTVSSEGLQLARTCATKLQQAEELTERCVDYASQCTRELDRTERRLRVCIRGGAQDD